MLCIMCKYGEVILDDAYATYSNGRCICKRCHDRIVAGEPPMGRAELDALLVRLEVVSA